MSDQFDKLSSVFGNAEDILKIIKEDTQMGAIADGMQRSPVYRQGEQHGRDLMRDSIPGEQAVVKKYQGFLSILNKMEEEAILYKKNALEAELASIDGNIEQINRQLNEEDPLSAISRIRKRMETLRQKIDELEQRKDESIFIEDFNKVFEEKLKADLDEIKALVEERKITRNIASTEISGLKNLVDDLLSSENLRKVGRHSDLLEKMADFRSLLEHFPLFTEHEPPPEKQSEKPWSTITFSANRSTEPDDYVEQRIETLNDVIEEKFGNLNLFLKESRPFILTNMQLYIKYIIAGLILIGEVYIVFQFLSVIAGLETERMDSLGFWFRVLFSLSYPLAIGFTFNKFLHTQSNRFKTQRRLFKIGILVLITGLVVGGIMVAAKVPNAPWKQYIPYILLLKSLFLPILTLLFSIAGTLSLHEAMAAFRQYKRHHQVLEENSNAQTNTNAHKEELEKEAQKIEALIDKRNDLLTKRAEREAALKSLTMPYDYTAFINSMIALATSLYKTGFNAGRAQAMREKNEDEILIIHLKQQFFNHENVE